MNSYARIRFRLAGYVLGLAESVREMDGRAGLEERIKLAAIESGRQKAEDMRSVELAKRHQAMAKRFKRMLTDFGGRNIQISSSNGGATQTVNNRNCPCLRYFVNQAERFGFTRKEVRQSCCMICLPAYSAGAEIASVGFKGKLTQNGCQMRFSRPISQ